MASKVIIVSSLFYRAALEKKTAGMVSAALPVRAAEKLAPAQYIRYTPSQQVKNVFGTIHLRRRKIFTIFYPYPPTIGIPAKCL